MTAMGRTKEAKANTKPIRHNSITHVQGCFWLNAVSFSVRAKIKMPKYSKKVNSGSLATKLLYRMAEGSSAVSAMEITPQTGPPARRPMRQTRIIAPICSTRLNSSAVVTLSPKMPRTQESTAGYPKTCGNMDT